jgi:hypothetical protein
MSDSDGDGEGSHRDAGITALVDRRFDRAGDRYSQAAYAELAEREGKGRDTFDPEGRGWVGYALGALAVSAVAYRVAGADDRARNRALQGALIAVDQRDHVRSDVLAAGCQEFVGDFRAIAGKQEAAGKAYDRAAAAYENADLGEDDPLDWSTAPLLHAAADTIAHLSRNTSAAVEWDDLHGSDPSTVEYLAHRPRFRKRRMPAVLRAVDEAGRLHPPRGTTEHNSDDWVCPDCSTNEVNWIGGEVVCLDCSTRLDHL